MTRNFHRGPSVYSRMRLHRVTAVCGLVLLLAAALGLAAMTFRAAITGETLSNAKRTVRFTFKAAGGTAARFRCALGQSGTQLQFRNCHSPATYKHLQEATYTFSVYAVNSAGVLSMGSTRSFAITPALSGTYEGNTSQTRPKFASGVKIVIRDGVVAPSSSISWAAHCTGQVSSLTDKTHFSGSVHHGHFVDQHPQTQHLQGDTENNSISVHFAINAKRATGTFTDTTQVLHGSSPIAQCSTGTVRFTARHA